MSDSLVKKRSCKKSKKIKTETKEDLTRAKSDSIEVEASKVAKKTRSDEIIDNALDEVLVGKMPDVPKDCDIDREILKSFSSEKKLFVVKTLLGNLFCLIANHLSFPHLSMTRSKLLVSICWHKLYLVYFVIIVLYLL